MQSGAEGRTEKGSGFAVYLGEPCGCLVRFSFEPRNTYLSLKKYQEETLTQASSWGGSLGGGGWALPSRQLWAQHSRDPSVWFILYEMRLRHTHTCADAVTKPSRNAYLKKKGIRQTLATDRNVQQGY